MSALPLAFLDFRSRKVFHANFDHLRFNGMIVGSPATINGALEKISNYAEPMLKLPTRFVIDALVQRERLSSSINCGGIAIPHTMFAELVQSLMIITVLDRAINVD